MAGQRPTPPGIPPVEQHYGRPRRGRKKTSFSAAARSGAGSSSREDLRQMNGLPASGSLQGPKSGRGVVCMTRHWCCDGQGPRGGNGHRPAACERPDGRAARAGRVPPRGAARTLMVWHRAGIRWSPKRRSPKRIRLGAVSHSQRASEGKRTSCFLGVGGMACLKGAEP